MKTGGYSLMIYTALAIVFSSLFSCGQKEHVKQTAAEPVPVSVNKKLFTKPSSGLADTLKVSGHSAVFFLSDTSQLQKVKSLISPDVFESLAHDCFYQMRNARIVLKKYFKKVKIIETSKARWLLFEDANHKQSLVDLDKNNELCGIYLFNAEDAPLFIDMMNIDTQAEFYFNKK